MKKPKTKSTKSSKNDHKSRSPNAQVLPKNVQNVLQKTYSQSKNLLAPFLLKRLKLKQRFLVIVVVIAIIIWSKEGYLAKISLYVRGGKVRNSAKTPAETAFGGMDPKNLNVHPMFTKPQKDKENNSPMIALNPKFNAVMPAGGGVAGAAALGALKQYADSNPVGYVPIDDGLHPAMNHPIDQPPAQIMSPEDIWKMASSFLTNREVYPAHKQFEVSLILRMMATTKIIAADVLPKGTQLKLLLVLKGGQKVVFKPKRFDRDYVVPGNSWDGFDRHNAEVAGFHLDSILHFRRAPLVVGRVIHFRKEIIKVATERLKQTFRYIDKNDDNNDPTLCFFGKCYYCKEEDLVCPESNGLLEGTLTLWIERSDLEMEKLRHPYQRTYTETRQARWETDEKYCNLAVKKESPYDKGPRLLDITDASVFDYLIGNGDRHHYEVFKQFGNDGMLIMLDNAKSFGNSSLHDKSILSPLRQCCILRTESWGIKFSFSIFFYPK